MAQKRQVGDLSWVTSMASALLVRRDSKVRLEQDTMLFSTQPPILIRFLSDETGTHISLDGYSERT